MSDRAQRRTGYYIARPASTTVPGVVRLATDAESAGGSSDSVVPVVRQNRRESISSRWRRFVFTSWVSAVASGGAVAQNANSARVNSSSTPNGTAILYLVEQMLLSGASKGFIPFASRMVIACRFTMAQATTNGISRLLIGKSGTPTFAALADSGFGFEVRNLTIWIVRHNGTTLAEDSTGVTMTTNTAYNVEVESDGAGNLNAVINGTSYGPYTGGPTANTTTARTISMESGNGGDSAGQIFDPVHLAISAQ
jgi:hypothetical protein